jgi:dihydrofolate synthase / folylpolyglutamate synthase
MTYPDSVQYLYALGNEIRTVKLGLDSIHTLLDALGNPQDTYRVVHVAGTNGKGSTCAMIEAGLRAAGVRTGLYTSPHLIEPTERIKIDGVDVTDAQFLNAFERVHRVAEELVEQGKLEGHPTYFETVTAMAFLLFQDAAIDTLVCEVGLGGRLDATNVVRPSLCVITAIDYDHEQYLGNTLTLIAGEKAGIMKPGVPVVFSRQRVEAEWELTARAGNLKLDPVRTSDFEIANLVADRHGCRYDAGDMHVECPLAGPHQIENSLTAAVALRQLGFGPGGIAQTRWPGRLERFATKPEIVLDGAHNPAGARVLARYLEDFYKDTRVWLIYGTMRDKAVEEVTGLLFPIAHRLILTAPDNARALRPESLQIHYPEASVAPNLAAAIDLARSEASPEDTVFITGSLFLVGEARRLLLMAS